MMRVCFTDLFLADRALDPPQMRQTAGLVYRSASHQSFRDNAIAGGGSRRTACGSQAARPRCTPDAAALRVLFGADVERGEQPLGARLIAPEIQLAAEIEGLLELAGTGADVAPRVGELGGAEPR